MTTSRVLPFHNGNKRGAHMEHSGAGMSTCVHGTWFFSHIRQAAGLRSGSKFVRANILAL